MYAAFVASAADAHGRSWDEGAQDWYGQAVYQWYVSRGADQTFLRAAPQLQMPQHGPVVELVIAAAQHAFDGTDRWHVRSLVGGVIGALGVLAIALCGLELGGWWVAFLAAAGLALYPRYTGAIFNNSKDVPLAVAMIFLLWLTLRLARRWAAGGTYLSDSALVGVCLGVAVAIRVNALLWLGVLAAAAAVWWLRHPGQGRAALARPAAAGLVIVGFGYLTAMALWPYVALHPVDGLVDSIRSMSRYAWTGTIPYAGELTRADQLPRSYAPVWLVIGSPLPTVVFGLIGLGFVAADLIRQRLTDARVLLVVGLLVAPLAAIVVLRPTLYNGPRHFLFAVPGLVLLGALGLCRVWAAVLSPTPTAPRRAVAAALVGVTVLAWAHTTVAAGRLYPFEYMYFSPVVGGYPGARGSYETDYWGLCQNPALRWLVANHRAHPTPRPPSVGGLFDEAVRTPPGFTAGSATPDFFVSSPYFPTPAGYRPIHHVIVAGAPLCTVSVNPTPVPR